MKAFRVLLIITVLLLVLGIGFLIFSVHSRLTTSEYLFQVDAVFSAASVANQDEPLTESDKAVIADYEGQKSVIVPGNYKSLSFYLRKDAYMQPFMRMDKDKALKVTVCDETAFWILPKEDNSDIVWIRLETGGKTFDMRTDGGNQWSSLLAICTKGTYHDENIPLE